MGRRQIWASPSQLGSVPNLAVASLPGGGGRGRVVVHSTAAEEQGTDARISAVNHGGLHPAENDAT